MSDLAILTEKKIVTFAEEDGETRSITLYPFGFKHFNAAIASINKYWSAYAAVKNEFSEEVKLIAQSDDDTETKARNISLLKETFDEVGMIVKNVMATADDKLGDDIAAMIGFCSRKELNLEEFHWGEVGALLAAAIEVNMDFFARNQSKITLLKPVEEKPLQSATDGDTKSES